MIGIYFSGTGNTRWCVETLLQALGGENAYGIETPAAAEALRTHDDVVLGYPIYFSSLPKIVSDFLATNQAAFRGKRVFLLCTMGLFSGDGTGCAARRLRGYGAQVTGGLHLSMPDCIADEKALKRPLEQNRAKVRAAKEKITAAAHAIQAGNPPQQGLSAFSHVAGLFGQRLWFGGKVRDYSAKLRIDPSKCVGCGTCVTACPMKNLRLEDAVAAAESRCTMCYRCISLCPQSAITLLGHKVHEQSRIERYL